MAGAFDAWIGRTESVDDVISRAPIAGLAALLNYQHAPWAEAAPPLAHWLYFLPREPQSGLGPDGHPKRGGFLPPIELPRRMWAGGRLKFHAPLPIGAAARRVSTIRSITPKQGASGAMVFVTVAHAIHADGALAVEEEQDIVYRTIGTSAPASVGPDTRTPARQTRFAPDETALFRFSALTFNAHRIHYDAPYARDVEHYPALVVHGPLIATALMHHGLYGVPAPVRAFNFRAKRPLFLGETASLCTDGAGALWCRNARGESTMDAEILF